MKVPLAAIVLAAAAFLNVAHAQIIVSSGTNSTLLYRNPRIQLDQPRIFSLTNATPLLNFTNSNLVAPEMSLSASKAPAPGVYESHPYACIVIVPGSTGDNCIAGKPGPSKMPDKNPGVTLVPLSATSP